MARRTRRPTVVWLPVDLENRIGQAGAATDGFNNSGFQIGITTAPAGTQATAVWPVVKDNPQAGNIAASSSTLADLEGSSYRLRRVVGKIFVQPNQVPSSELSQNDTTTWMVTCGLIVLGVEFDGTTLNPSALAYDVQALNSTRDPWIWRRSWVLTNTLGAAGLDVAEPGSRPLLFPSSNAEYGSAPDGPHIDAKTARVIGNEERLFFVASAVGLDGQAQGAEQVIAIFGEVRVLASMRKQSGNRRNASR